MHDRVLVASSNAGKVREFAESLAGSGFEVISLADAGLADESAPDENGSSFEENALLKARYYFERSGIVTIADDSGLEVAILGGRPGLMSARYGADDRERIDRLLAELDGVPSAERAARFVCAIALAGENLAETFLGVCAGSIRHVPAGTNGFGYDPIFVPDGQKLSFAEMSAGEKRAVGHRGQAIRALVQFVTGQ